MIRPTKFCWKKSWNNKNMLLNNIMLILSKKVIWYSKAFKFPCYKKLILDENPKKQGFHTWQNSEKQQNLKKKCLLKIIPEWLCITTIYPISFMKMLLLISTHWWIQNFIGSGMALGWSDTPQFKRHRLGEVMQWKKRISYGILL